MKDRWRITVNVFYGLVGFLLMASFFFYLGAKTAEKDFADENATLRKMYTDLRKEHMAKGDRP